MGESILIDNERVVKEFGAKRVSDLRDTPDHYTFKRNLVYSHREFDHFFSALKKGEKCALVSGLNASGHLHLGHKALFDLILYLQKKYDLELFVPISDDESYVAGKVESQEQGLAYSLELAKQILAYGFLPSKTSIIIDQVYTPIYNFAIKLSKKITLSEVKATYGYTNEDNPGLHFYPAIQSAHVLFPQTVGFRHVLVPIGPDEDAHLRIARDVAPLFKYTKPSVLHMQFMPGTDGEKMSKSKNNAIFLTDSQEVLKKKVFSAFSGGKDTLEEHRRLGGNPDIDIACLYLRDYFFDEKKGAKLFSDYRKGTLTSGDVKKLLYTELSTFMDEFQKRSKKVTEATLKKVIRVPEKPHIFK